MINICLITIIVISLVAISLISPNLAFAESWYGGKGLKQGDFFRYSVCDVEYHNCNPINIGFWVQNQSSTSHDYFLQMFAIDGSNIQKGTVMTTPDLDPVYSDPNISNYSNVYKNTILYLGKLSPSESPKDFSYPTWSSLGMCCSIDRGIRPLGQEQVTVQAGSYETWVVGVNDTNSNSNIKFWVEPNMPFPIKGIWTYVTQGTSNLQFSFELLETGNNKTGPTWHMLQTIPPQQTCPSNQFSVYGHCYAIGAPYIPNPTAGCGQNGRMCASMSCPSGYAMIPIYINGSLNLSQCVNLSNCPTGTISHDNTCVIIETGQQESTQKSLRLMAFIFENGTMTFNNPIVGDDRASDLPLDDSGDVRILYMHDDKKIAETGFNFTKTCTIVDSPMGSTMICHNWMSFVKWIPDVEGADKIIFKWKDKVLREVKLIEKLPPRQQISNGVLPENVVCSDGMMLVKKSFENSVVCVKPQTAQKLVERGWGILITSMNTTNPESICKASGGNWDEKYRECVGVSNLTCKALNGIYTGCDSACRHTPKEEGLGCIAVCVQVCTVK